MVRAGAMYCYVACTSVGRPVIIFSLLSSWEAQNMLSLLCIEYIEAPN